ncbi:putative YigZ family protein [Salibacterium salarium]|uniref:YigZ family protein n=1 Tax=Salibacterium salarium TaxID=284579 RepID=UPI00278047FF|nr:YigZ family protein [Salibacterium salarium]MDQ0298205.1 putative YigZ family protein [Salibacterium salarium]
MLSSYYTVKSTGTNEITINKSRFIAHVKRVTTENEAQEFIQAVKKEHSSATHNCSAYMIGEQDNIQKANDDGEPSRTAGVPMLEVLKKRHLKDTCVVVTRYFGGIKLGAGGLIRAYGSSVTEGINAVGVVNRQLMNVIGITLDYTWLGKMENEIRQSSYLLKDVLYEESVCFLVYVPIDNVTSFTDWVTNITNGQGIIEEKEEVYLEEDVTEK